MFLTGISYVYADFFPAQRYMLASIDAEKILQVSIFSSLLISFESVFQISTKISEKMLPMILKRKINIGDLLSKSIIVSKKTVEENTHLLFLLITAFYLPGIAMVYPITADILNDGWVGTYLLSLTHALITTFSTVVISAFAAFGLYMPRHLFFRKKDQASLFEK